MYQFKSDDGEVIERDFRMSDCPDLGFPIHFKGRTYRRILSMPARVGLAEHDSNSYPRVSRALPKYTKNCPLNEKGQPVILNKAHERQILRENNYSRDYD